MKKYFYVIILLILGLCAYGQGSISGKVINGETGEALIGANIDIIETGNGAISDFSGKFVVENVMNGEYNLLISYLGYEEVKKKVTIDDNLLQLGVIKLKPGSVGLSEIVVAGVIDVVKDRKTPVASSIIHASEIQLKLGNQEFPEIMKSTPSIYATKEGGGYGDSRINVRGFDQRNVSVIINGQPVNDMENGWVYWSNWAGLQDVASGLEIQRGIGASRLAVPSVGGTINIITKSSERNKGGFVSVGIGNDGYFKTTASYSTGQNDKGWSSTLLLGRWQGNGYVDGTKGEGYNYLASVGYEPSKSHHINFSLTGAAQWHNQRRQYLSIYDYFTFSEHKDEPNRKFNSDWGVLDGEEYTLRRNFYNKPIATLNYAWEINENLTWSNALYGSWGRGGGTGSRGRNFGISPYRKDLTTAINDGDLPYRTEKGIIDFDKVVANNKSGTTYSGRNPIIPSDAVIGTNDKYAGKVNGVNSNIAIRRSSINSHNWYGLISNLKYKYKDFTLGVGLDGRNYHGLHYQVVNDLLGLDGYMSMGDKFSQFNYVNFGTDSMPEYHATEGRYVTTTSGASPFSNISNSQKINYYNIAIVNWMGVNGLIEYDKDMFSAVAQFGLSNQWYQRIDYFDYLPAFSEVHSQFGGFIKGGVNYNIDEHFNVFGNVGYISRQPIFDAIFPNNENDIKDVDNEAITSLELGSGVIYETFRAKLNLYRTVWTNRFLSRSINIGNGVEGTATFTNLANIHLGIEIEGEYRVIEPLSLNFMASLGDWKYNGDVIANVFDDNQNQIAEDTLFLEGVKVGDAAQTTISAGADFRIFEGLSIDATWYFYGNLYGNFNVLDEEFSVANNKGAVKLPNYHLVDAGITYSHKLGRNLLTVRINVNNLFDAEYLSELETNIHVPDNAKEGSLYKGIDKSNFGWFGFGRTWNLSLKYNF